MGHAGVFVETREARVLLDPILRTTPIASGAVAHAIPRVLTLGRMPRPTEVVITHAHLDHFDPESLRDIPRDIPFVVPPDDKMIGELRALGFDKLIRLRPWESHRTGDLLMTATPSGVEIDELGMLFEELDEAGRPRASFWHMSDAETTVEIADTVTARGTVDLLSVKYQPTARVQGQVFRTLGACFDKKDVVEWLETACGARPRVAFPYASGISFIGRYAWNNRYAFPFSTEEIVALLDERLQPSGGRACAPVAGDIFEIGGGAVNLVAQASPFVARGEGGGEPVWEPIDESTLVGCSTPAERTELEQRLDELLPRLFRTWLKKEIESPIGHYALYGAIWQLVVHAGDGERLHYAVDFTERRPSLRFERHPRANYFVHVAGRSLLEVLRGEADAVLFHAGGDLRTYEKIIGVREGKFWAPPVQGWDLIDRLTEPLTYYLRHRTKFPLEGD